MTWVKNIRRCFSNRPLVTHEYTVRRRLLRRFSTRWGWSSSAGLLEKMALKKNLRYGNRLRPYP